MKAFIRSPLFLLLVFLLTIGAFTYLARLIKRPLVYPTGPIQAQAYFSPDDDVRSVLIGLIDQEKQRISIAMYIITDAAIASALIRAFKRGIDVECVVDQQYSKDRSSKVPLLANASIPICIYEGDDALIHHKFCIFEEQSLLWTGSYNFTKRASERNQENVIILSNASIMRQFRAQFERLKERSLCLTRKPAKASSSWWETVLKKIKVDSEMAL